MLDFKELPSDGQAFEQLVRELLFSYGLHVEWSGKGADGGRDLICREIISGFFVPETKVWLVQCKHFAHADRSVGVADLDDVVDSCHQHNATGYLLACSTQPSSAVVDRLEGVTHNPNNQITATYWDGITIERLLSTPHRWGIAQRFMPASSGSWKLYATERPNDFVAHYKGYVFHLTNRIGSSISYHLPSVEQRIAEIEALRFPKGHFIRIRAIWHDDKNGGYVWYVDYMHPNGSEPSTSEEQLCHVLRDGWALEDGQVYSWDISFVEYYPMSDHYDKDHYDYYVYHLPNFLSGSPREESNKKYRFGFQQTIAELDKELESKRDSAFKEMVEQFERVPFVEVMRGINAGIEHVHKFSRRFVWSDLIFSDDIVAENLFSAKLILRVSDEAKLHNLLARIPIDVEKHFRIGKVELYFPEEGRIVEKEPIYDLHLSIHPTLLSDRYAAREAFDEYFREIAAAIKKYLS